MPFDLVVMNPPFTNVRSRDGRGSKHFYLRFARAAQDQLAEGGIAAFVLPSSWKFNRNRLRGSIIARGAVTWGEIPADWIVYRKGREALDYCGVRKVAAFDLEAHYSYAGIDKKGTHAAERVVPLTGTAGTVVRMVTRGEAARGYYGRAKLCVVHKDRLKRVILDLDGGVCPSADFIVLLGDRGELERAAEFFDGFNLSSVAGGVRPYVNLGAFRRAFLR